MLATSVRLIGAPSYLEIAKVLIGRKVSPRAIYLD